MTSALHSASTAEHGSPPVAVELGRYALGVIDLDPASSNYWQRHTTQATAYYDRESDGLRQPWTGRVWLNAPGGNKEAGERSLVRPFWERLVEHWLTGKIDGACWLSFSLEQLVQLQGSPAHPLQMVTLVFCERLDYLRKPPGGGPPVKGGAPTHGSAMTLLPSRRDPDEARRQVDRFWERGRQHGAVVLPMVERRGR